MPGHQTRVKELLAQSGDKYRCDACGDLDWTIIDFLKGPVSKLCFDCWMRIQETMKEGDDEHTQTNPLE